MPDRHDGRSTWWQVGMILNWHESERPECFGNELTDRQTSAILESLWRLKTWNPFPFLTLIMCRCGAWPMWTRTECWTMKSLPSQCILSRYKYFCSVANIFVLIQIKCEGHNLPDVLPEHLLPPGHRQEGQINGD